MSWEDIDKEGVEEKPTEDQLKKFSRLCHNVFELTPDGKELMCTLNSHLDTPVCPPDKEAAYGFFREGQNNIIRQIKNAIAYQKQILGGKE